MRISVYCSSAPDIDQEHLDLAYEIGKGIGQRGWDLVWGGGAISMMGAVARGTREHGGKTFGVIPTKLLLLEIEDKESTEIIEVDSMRTRKAKIEELSDAFIALPGGIGTLEEFFEIWVGRYLKFHDKPVIILDPYGVYQPLHALVEHLENENFVKPGMRDLLHWTTTVDEAIAIAHGKQ